MASKRTSCRRYAPPPPGVRVVNALATLLAITSMRMRSAAMPDALMFPETSMSSKAIRHPYRLQKADCRRQKSNLQSSICNLRSLDCRSELGQLVRHHLGVHLEI